MFLFKKHPSVSLSQIDNLYGKIISKLALPNRIEYCESLIYRAKKDVLTTKCPIQKRKLRKLIKVAQSEIKMLLKK